MMKITERVKVDLALTPQTLNNSNATGPYFPMKDYRGAAAILIAGAAAATKTSKIELLEATDAAGTSAQAITSASATATANSSATEATATLSSVTAGDTVTIGAGGETYTFTAHASTTTKADREFSIGGTDTADAEELADCINDPDYGVPGITASAASGVVTLTATKPGEALIESLATSGVTVTFATTKHAAYVEIPNIALSDGFSHIAAKVTTTGNTPVAAILLREPREFPASQKAAASAIV